MQAVIILVLLAQIMVLQPVFHVYHLKIEMIFHQPQLIIVLAKLNFLIITYFYVLPAIILANIAQVQQITNVLAVQQVQIELIMLILQIHVPVPQAIMTVV